jgi:sugar lactone lactonase YvrE
VVDGPNKGADPPYTVSIVALGAQQKRTVAQLGAARGISGGPYHDPDRRRVLVVEYAELPVEGAPPRGHLVDLATGKQTSFEIPVTTYGVSFDPDGRMIYLYSSQLGKLMAVDAATGKRGKVLEVGTHGHALGFAVKGTLLVLRNSGLQPVETRRLVKKAFVPMKRLYPGFSHVESSLISPGHAVIKNGAVIHIVETR